MCFNLLRLSQMLLKKDFDVLVEEQFKVFTEDVMQSPVSYAQFLSAFSFAFGPSRQIVIAEGKDKALVGQIVDLTFRKFLPFKVLVLRPHDQHQLKVLNDLSSFITEQKPLQDKTTVYVCENHVCRLPVNTLNDYENIIK